MAEQKRFKKRVLNKDDHKATENGAKVVKGIAGVFGAVALVVLNKDNPAVLSSAGVFRADCNVSVF